MNEETIILKMRSEDIDYFSKIIEACNHLGIVSTLDTSSGLVSILATPDTRQEIEKIINHLEIPIQMVDCETNPIGYSEEKIP